MQSPFSVIAFALICGALAWASPADACVCGMSNNCGLLAKSDAVFEATIERFAGGRFKTASGQEMIGGRQTIILKDVRAYRGDAPTTMVSEFSTCSYPFELGKRYLIQAGRLRDGSLTTSSCSFTRPVDGNEDLVDYAKSFEGQATQTRLMGSILTIRTLTPKYEMAPVANRRVTITGPGTITVTTDTDGRFSVLNLPPGKYRVSADVRRTDWYRDEEFTWAPTDQYACAKADFIEPPDGKVSGVIVDDDGKPIAGAFIYLRPDDPNDPDGYRGGGMGQSVDENGRFFFEDLPPGRYNIGDAPYRTTITLGLGESLDVGKIRRPR